MKLLLSFASLVSGRLMRGLSSLQAALRDAVPRQEPVFVPIPIPAERQARPSGRRRPGRFG